MIINDNDNDNDNGNDTIWISSSPSCFNKLVSCIVDVCKSRRDSTYFALLSSILLLSSLPTIFVDPYYIFCATTTGDLIIYSIATATKLCELSVHTGECSQLAVYTSEKQTTRNSELNRNRDYFICTLSRQERLIVLHLFNDREIPLKTLFKSLRGGKKRERDYSSIALTKLAILFIPCNSAIQKNACSLCRHQSHSTHTRITSDLFIFQSNLDEMNASLPTALSFFSFHRSEHSATIDDIDYSTTGFGGNSNLAGILEGGINSNEFTPSTAMNAITPSTSSPMGGVGLGDHPRDPQYEYGQGMKDWWSEQQTPSQSQRSLTGMKKGNDFGGDREPLLLSSELPSSKPLCQCCNAPLVNVKSTLRRAFRWIPHWSHYLCCCCCCCCCDPHSNPADYVIIQPQSLMPTSYSQDMLLKRHLPPTSLPVCASCVTEILSGRQTLLQNMNSGLSMTMSLPGEESNWISHLAGGSMVGGNVGGNVGGFGGFGRDRRTDLHRTTTGVSLSVLLAHIGHNVGDPETDKDVKLYILPWGEQHYGVKRKRVNALRVYLKLRDIVLVWYDVVIPDE